MTDLLHDDDLKTERETASEPAKRWRNRYRARQVFTATCKGVPYATLQPGELFWGHTVWPSKEIAETQAFSPGTSASVGHADWLDAFPVEGEGA